MGESISQEGVDTAAWCVGKGTGPGSQRAEKRQHQYQQCSGPRMLSLLLMALGFLFSGSLHVGRWTVPSGSNGSSSPRVFCPCSPLLPCRLWSMASPTSPVHWPLTLSFASWPSAPGLGLSRCILCHCGAQGLRGSLMCHPLHVGILA